MKEGVEKMIREFTSSPGELIAGIGPGIGSCHFEVQDDVAGKFSEFLDSALFEKEERIFLDLKKIAFAQFVREGITPKNIETDAGCTYCLAEKYYSYRRDKSHPKDVEAMMVVFGMRP